MEQSANQNDRNVASYGSEMSSDGQSRIRLQNLHRRCVKMQNKLKTENKNNCVARTKSGRNTCRSENVSTRLQSSNCDRLELNPSYQAKTKNDYDNENVGVKPTNTSSCVKTEAVTGLHFSFEDIPENEPWYQTFLRQDKGEEIDFSPASDFNRMKSLHFPYKIVPDHFDTLNKKLGFRQTTNVDTKKSFESQNNERKSLRWHPPTLSTLSRFWLNKKKTGGINEDNSSRNAGESSTSTAVTNTANNSNQNRGIDDGGQNVHRFLGLNSEIEGSYNNHDLPTVDASYEVNYGGSIKLHGSKYERFHRTAESLMDINMKYHELIDVDPAVLEALAISEKYAHCSVTEICSPIPNREGPTMDIVSLINGYDNCSCVKGFTEI